MLKLYFSKCFVIKINYFKEIGKFEINEDNLLVTDIQFDREKRKEYDVIIKAWDRGVPPK